MSCLLGIFRWKPEKANKEPSAWYGALIIKQAPS
jgi:hypothetical protein